MTCLVYLPSNIHPCLVYQDIHSTSAQPVADISFVDRKKDFVDFINHINGDKGNCIDYQIGNVLTIKATCLCILFILAVKHDSDPIIKKFGHKIPHKKLNPYLILCMKWLNNWLVYQYVYTFQPIMWSDCSYVLLMLLLLFSIIHNWFINIITLVTSCGSPFRHLDRLLIPYSHASSGYLMRTGSSIWITLDEKIKHNSRMCQFIGDFGLEKAKILEIFLILTSYGWLGYVIGQ